MDYWGDIVMKEERPGMCARLTACLLKLRRVSGVPYRVSACLRRWQRG